MTGPIQPASCSCGRTPSSRGEAPAVCPRPSAWALPRILWSVTARDLRQVFAGLTWRDRWDCDDPGTWWRVGVTRQRGPGRTQESAKTPVPVSWSLVACSVCRDACRFPCPRPRPGRLGGGPATAGPAVSAAAGSAGAPGRGHGRRGGDLRVAHGLVGVLPGLRVGVRAGARRVLPDRGRRRGRGPPAAGHRAGPAARVREPVLPQGHVRPASGRAEQQVLPTEHSADGDAHRVRAGTRREGRQPAGRTAGHRRAPRRSCDCSPPSPSTRPARHRKYSVSTTLPCAKVMSAEPC
jgi:hypothetical protein